MNIKTRTDLETAMISLLASGPASNRVLWDRCWSARVFMGTKEAERIAREIATPDQDPPEPDTKWRLKA